MLAQCHAVPAIATTRQSRIEQHIDAIRSLFAGRHAALLPFLLAGTSSLVIWHSADTLAPNGRIALIVLTCAVIGWVMTKIDDAKIAIAAVVVLAATGVADKKQIYAALGHELIWLLIAAFVIGAVLRASGLLERAISVMAARASTHGQLFYGLSCAIFATAFLIPSTSARAAMLVPVYLALADRITDANVRRALALLFPTAILLSAGGSLIGAGAHVVAVETISRTTGTSIGYLGWIILAGPFAFATTMAATCLIIKLHLTPDQAAAPFVHQKTATEPLSTPQWLIIGVIAATVLLWILAPLHGVGIGVVALGSMAILISKSICPLKPKDTYKSVEVGLILFLTTTFILADVLTRTGADIWLASGLISSLPAGLESNSGLVVAIVASISLLAHLVVTSRTARAGVLFPAMVLPLIGVGHAPVMLVMVCVLGTGFCQTLTASAKPVAIFANLDKPTYEQADLIRLSIWMMPMLFSALIGYAFLVWKP